MSKDGYRITSQNYVSTRIKMVWSDSCLPWQLTQPRTLAWHLIFNVKFKVKGQGIGYCPEITSACIQKWSQTIAILPGQHTQPGPLNWHLTFKIKLKVNERGTGHRPKITTVRVTKWPEATVSLPGQLTQPLPLTWHLTSTCHTQGQRTGYRISYRNYVRTFTKMVSCDS